MELVRPSWPETWMSIARIIAQRSYDTSLKVGAVVASDDNSQMLSMGYNGNYRGGPHTRESDEPGLSGFIHAEVNALVKCDFNFHKKKHMYLTHSPCRICAKLIVNAEITRVVYDIPYRDTSGIEILTSAGINVFSLQEAIIRNKAP
jgi:dCMP deaminase